MLFKLKACNVILKDKTVVNYWTTDGTIPSSVAQSNLIVKPVQRTTEKKRKNSTNIESLMYN